MSIRVELQTPQNLDKLLTQALKEGKREGADEGLTWWHVQRLPKHFTTQSMGRYGYVPRSPVYMRQKKKKTGKNEPLVFTGELMRAMLTLKPNTSYSGDEAALRYRGLPSYLNLSWKYSTKDIAEQLEKYDGDMKAAAIALGANLKTVLQRVERHMGPQPKGEGRYKLAKEALAEFAAKFKGDPVEEWKAKHLAAVALFEASGRDLRKAADAMGVRDPTFARYLRNPEYKGKQRGQVVDKLKELTTIIDSEVASMAKKMQEAVDKKLRAAERGR